MRKLLFICAVVILFLVGCREDKIYHEDGYIVFDNYDFIEFVPVKNINLETSISSLYTENLGEGLQFMSSKKFFDDVFSKIDTFNLENRDKDEPKEYWVLKIVPVHMEYKMYPKKFQPLNDLGIRPYTFKIRGRKVVLKINYNVKYEILKITPLPVKKRNAKPPINFMIF